MTLVDWGLLLAAALCLGSSFLFINLTVREISPLTGAALRALVALPVCWGLMRAFGVQLPRTRTGWIALFWLGLLTGAIPYGAIAWGQQHIESGMAGILYGTMPLLTVVLAPMFLNEETFTRRRLVGAVVGLAGIILLIGPSVLANASSHVLGLAITFLAPLGNTLGTIYARRQTTLTPPVMAIGQMIFGTLILAPIAFAVETPLALDPGIETIAALLTTSIVCTAGGSSFYFVVVRRIGATRSSLVPLFFPVVAIALGAVFLGERLPLEAFIGLALIMAGALAVSGAALPGRATGRLRG
jgi:drug/metabolite transporter (DMT)-like permease